LAAFLNSLLVSEGGTSRVASRADVLSKQSIIMQLIEFKKCSLTFLIDGIVLIIMIIFKHPNRNNSISTQERIQDMLLIIIFGIENIECTYRELENLHPGTLEFRNAETPRFIPKDFTQKCWIP
jgi:hypothetical protein